VNGSIGSVLIWFGVLVSLIAFCIHCHLRPHSASVFIHPDSSWSPEDHLKTDKVPIFENILILKSPVGTEDKVRRLNHQQNLARILDVVRPRLEGEEQLGLAGSDDACGFPCLRRWSAEISQWILRKQTALGTYDLIGRSLAAIAEFQVGLNKTVWKEFKFGADNGQIRPQLFLSSTTGKVNSRFCGASLPPGGSRDDQGNERKAKVDPKAPSYPFIGIFCGYGAFLAAFAAGHLVITFHDNRGIRFRILLILCASGMVAGLGWGLWLQWLDLQQDEHSDNRQILQHIPEMVPQKHLDTRQPYRSLEALSPKKKTSKPGRPPLPKGESKGKFLRVRATPDELKAIEAAAKANNQTVSEWIRSKLNAALQG
jgi:hypothetical protein